MKSKVCAGCGGTFFQNKEKGYCNFHKAKFCGWDCYQASKKFTPERAVAAFWAKVDKRGPEDCWDWTGAKRWDGYGRLHYLRKQTTANRVSYELANGPIAPGLTIMHTCDRPSCCNPAHLRAGTHSENMRDMSNKNRAGGQKMTPDDIREIRRKSAEGKTDRELAAEYNSVPRWIWAIRSRRVWTHVE